MSLRTIFSALLLMLLVAGCGKTVCKSCSYTDVIRIYKAHLVDESDTHLVFKISKELYRSGPNMTKLLDMVKEFVVAKKDAVVDLCPMTQSKSPECSGKPEYAVPYAVRMEILDPQKQPEVVKMVKFSDYETSPEVMYR